MHTRSWLALALAACTGDAEEPDIGPPPPAEPEDSAPVTVAPTGTTGDTAVVPTGDTAPPVVIDCDNLLPNPISMMELGAPRGYHGLAFDTVGNIIGSDGNALLSVTYLNDVFVLVPGLGQIQGMDWLLDGDLVVASDSFAALTRINITSGAASPIATDIGAYGVVVGPNGLIYAADRQNVYRIDPTTGVKELWINGNGFSPQSVNFSPDYSKFYMTSQTGWALYEIDLDANLEKASERRQLADFGQSYRDGLAVDYCGYIYVPDYGTEKLFRISPEGQVNTYVNFGSLQNYGHYAVFGSGIGGWKHDALYLPKPYGDYKVIEIEVGIPGRTWVP